MSTNAAMYDNPSAGKFEPPPAPPGPGVARARAGRKVAVLLVLALAVARWRFPSVRGLTALHWVVLPIALKVLDVVLFKSEADERGPYSDEGRLTR